MKMICSRNLRRRTYLGLLPALLLAVGATGRTWAGDNCPGCPPVMATGITYQGQLKQGGAPLNGTRELRFSLWTQATEGALVAGPVVQSAVAVTNGLFTVEIDFGAAAFDGNPRWIEVVVCEGPTAGKPTCTTLSPRQTVTPAPYALQTRGIFVDDASRVGIGTPAPEEPLTVVGSVTLDAYDDNIGDLSAGALKFGFLSGEAIASNRDGLGVNAFGLDFYTLFQKRMSISNDGKVGVGTSNPQYPMHVIGESDDFTGVLQAVQTSGSTFGAAIYATSELTDGTAFISEANGAGAYAIWGRTDIGFAGVFDGDVDIAGTLSKSAGSFKIDHPLDPENKWLSHSFVESPDMMNVYNGNVVLGNEGTAWIELPSYFEALNSDFRYQLTAVGSAGPNLHVAREVHQNRFQIAGGSPGQKVSWQVTGVRQDAYARQNRIPVEQDKADSEKGRFHTPAAFGKGREFSVHSAKPSAGKPGESPELGTSHSRRRSIR